MDPRHTRIAREVAQRGHREFVAGPVQFLGGLAKDLQEAQQFSNTLMGLQCDQGVLLAPFLVPLNDLDCTFPMHHFTIDASYYGDVLGGAWNVYLFGYLGPSRFLSFLFPSEPTAICLRFSACGWCAVGDPAGFQQVCDIPGSMGKEIRLRGTDGN